MSDSSSELDVLRVQMGELRRIQDKLLSAVIHLYGALNSETAEPRSQQTKEYLDAVYRYLTEAIGDETAA